MKISGTVTMQAPREQAWAAFHDPGVLARTIPGVQSLTETGADAYDLAVVAGVAAIKGTYLGTVALGEHQPNDSFVLDAQGSGAPGTIGAKVAVRLADNAAGGTDIAYDADVIVGGAIGGVGQRMLSGVGKKMAAGFFAAIDEDIRTGGAVGAPAGLGGPFGTAVVTDAAPAAVAVGAATGAAARSWGPRPSAGSSLPGLRGGSSDLLVGLVLGAAIALIGVAVGRRSAGGR